MIHSAKPEVSTRHLQLGFLQALCSRRTAPVISTAKTLQGEQKEAAFAEGPRVSAGGSLPLRGLNGGAASGSAGPTLTQGRGFLVGPRIELS